MRLEFAHYNYKSRKTISAKDFARSIVSSADLSHLGRLLELVDDLSNDTRLKDVRITFEDFKTFSELRKKLLPFSLAIFSFADVQGLITRDDFQRAASHVQPFDLFLILIKMMVIGVTFKIMEGRILKPLNRCFVIAKSVFLISICQLLMMFDC